MAAQDDIPDDGTDLDRAIFFSDAVFAIAITLLALDIRVPALSAGSATAVVGKLLGLWPKFFSYAISFLVVGSYWVAHHRVFEDIRSYDLGCSIVTSFFCCSSVSCPFPRR